MYDVEGDLSRRDVCFKLLRRTVSQCPKEKAILKFKHQKLIKVEPPFSVEFSGLVIIKLLDLFTQTTVTVKVRFQRNVTLLEISKACSNAVVSTTDKM